jgi:hypothetical protein
MNGSPHRGHNLNLNLTTPWRLDLSGIAASTQRALRSNAGFSRRFGTVANFQRASRSAASHPHSCQCVFVRGCDPKSNKMEQNRTEMPRACTNQFAVSSLGRNAYIMRTKCAQKREREFSTPVTPITYNFNTLKCTDFLSSSHFRICDSSFFRISSLVIRHCSWAPGASLIIETWCLDFSPLLNSRPNPSHVICSPPL